MELKDLEQYEIIKEKNIKDINSFGTLLKHKKTGAKVFVLSNDDENKVFSVSFRTPPKDDSGVPHIIEHSVLCGSKKFPLKDPFVELAKGSLNTFLNAMTFPDKTMYPVASCNDKDFLNLMDVYLDAVFHPNISKEEKIFRQEGWTYKLESPEEDIECNGVVYNEMKGAFSSPEGVLEREILHSLFPDTCYAYESGGVPQKILDLTYEDFIEFYKTYYHPSNSYIYLYGNMDAAEKLDWIDKEYLSEFGLHNADSEINMQKPFEKMVEERIEYPISEEEEEKDNTYLSYNAVIGDNLDKVQYVAFTVIENAILGMPGAPLKQKLIDSGICKDVMSTYDNGLLQPYFAITAKYSNEENKEEFLKIVKDELVRISEEGIDKKALLAGINGYEFKCREADFGSYPKGLVYALNSLDSWIYDENEPYMHLESEETFAYLREQINTDYFEKLIKKYLIDNNHTSLVIMAPKKGIIAKKDGELKEVLKKLKSSMSKEEIDDMVRKTKELKEYQEKEESEEALQSIPLLKREDIGRDPLPFGYEEKSVKGCKLIWSNYFTSGIVYFDMYFDSTGISTELIPYLGLMKNIMGLMDTEKHSYFDLANETNIHTGGIQAGNIFLNRYLSENKYIVNTEFSVKMLYEEIKTGFELLKEVIFTTKFDDEKRLLELIREFKSRMQVMLSSYGNFFASIRANSYRSELSYFKELSSGIEFYKFICDLEENFEVKKQEIISNLYKVREEILHREAVVLSVTADEVGLEKCMAELEDIIDMVPDTKKLENTHNFELKKLNEGFKSPSQVQYFVRNGDFLEKGYEHTGALNVLRNIMNYEYLWNNIRVKGGAYGCSCYFTRNGDANFSSYRDPNLKETNEIFDCVAEYVKNFDVSERDMTKYVIGTVSELDAPITPQMKGNRNISAYFSEVPYERLCLERQQALDVTVEDIRNLAPLIEAAMQDKNYCVIGSESKITENEDMFGEVKSLM